MSTSNIVEAKNHLGINKRGGLPNFLNKINSADTIRIAYLGGSITAAEGWRVKSFKWLQEQYPKCQFVEINAAIGGTGSDLGAFRLAKDVLVKKPDLVFIEFAVNDGSMSKANIKRQNEGIVRQIWRDNPTTDICFVYTIMHTMIEKYKLGGVPSSVEATEEIANYYSIPSVNFAYEVVEQLNRKELIFKGQKSKDCNMSYFSPDGVHPFIDTGHEIYFNTLKHLFDELSTLEIKSKAHKLIEPLNTDNWENATILTFDKLLFKGDWKNKLSTDKYIQADNTGASVSFNFKGTIVGINDIIGPQGCKLDVFIDGQKYVKLRFDKYCTYDREHYAFIDNLTEGIHNVEIKLSDPITVEAKIEILKQRTPDAQTFPEKLSESKFRLKQIMIL